MKCPKCGSEIIFEDNDSGCECELSDKIICNKCGFIIATTDKNGMLKYYKVKEQMKYSHESEKLNSLCGKMVEITFFDNKTVKGMLEKDELMYGITYGYGYKLVCTDSYWHFNKSQIKKIKEQK